MTYLRVALILVSLGLLVVGAFGRRQTHQFKVFGLMFLFIGFLFQSSSMDTLVILFGIALYITPDFCLTVKEIYLRKRKGFSRKKK